MAFAVIQLTNPATLIITVDVPLEDHLPSLRSVFAEVRGLVQDTTQPMGIILDVRTLDVCFSDILFWVDECHRAEPSIFANPNLLPFVVGSHPMVAVALRKVKQQLGLSARQFAVLDDALAVLAQETAV